MVNYPCFVWAGCDLQTVSQPRDTRDTRDTEPGYRSVSRRHNVALTSSQCHIGVMLSCNSIMLSSKWCIDVIHLNLDGKNIHIFKKNCQSKNILDHLSSGLGISPNLRRGDLRHMRDMRHETSDDSKLLFTSQLQLGFQWNITQFSQQTQNIRVLLEKENSLGVTYIDNAIHYLHY